MIRHSVTIQSGNRRLVSIENFAIEENRITFLFGESGIGKSLISKAIYGLLDPAELNVFVDNKPYREHRSASRTRQMQESSFFVFQEPSSHLNPLLTIREQINEGSLRETPADKDILRYLWQTDDERNIKPILDIYPKPYRPSGGEKQRILLAMAYRKIALMQHASLQTPTFFVFDEPTGSLDNHYRNLFLELLLQKFQQRAFTVLFITHDYSIISELYRRPPQLLQHIQLKELTRIDDETEDQNVCMRDFSAHQYLEWLARISPAPAPSRAAEPVLSIQSPYSVFGHERRIYRDVGQRLETGIALHAGQMVYIKAPSGVGKTTLAKIIMGLSRPDRAAITIGSVSLTEKTPLSVWRKKIWGRKAGMVFQHADEALDMMCTVRETFKGIPGAQLWTDADVSRHLEMLFDSVSKGFLQTRVASLSGGQKQRLNLLRTLALESDLIILDEPLNGLDFESAKKVIRLLDDKKSQGAALLMISHNEEIFESVVDQEHIFYLS